MWREQTASRDLTGKRRQFKDEGNSRWLEKMFKELSPGLSNSCMQTYSYFIIVLAGVFAMLFIQSRLQGLSDFVPYQFAKNKYPYPATLLKPVALYWITFSLVVIVKLASQRIVFFIFLMIWTDLFKTWIY